MRIALIPQGRLLKIPPVLNRNIVHRHEPPVTSQQVKILQHDVEREFLVVDKPGSIVRSFDLTMSNDIHSSQILQPVHASGRYYKNSLIQILVNDFGYKKCYRKLVFFSQIHSSFDSF